MKNYLIIFICFLFFNIYSQSKDTIYFLINKKDVLIPRLNNSSNGKHTGYKIIDEKRIKKLNQTPLVEGKVWVPESDDDFYQFGPSFTFNRNKDTVVSKSYINSIKLFVIEESF